jgi:hypothetical protein
MVSQDTSGVISSWYPYYSGSSDLGISSYRWRRLLIDKGGYGTDTGSYVDVGVGKTRLYGDGTIFADTLGTTATAPSPSAAGSPRTVVQTGGYLRVYFTSSSRRYKENIESLNSAEMYRIISNLNPVTFNFKKEKVADNEYGLKQWGLIAEDVDAVSPGDDLVVYKDGQIESVRYEILPTYLLGAFKEMANKINSLQEQLDNLKK